MKRVEIFINGEAYPCSPTMGAMLRFKEETGREVTEIRTDSPTDLCTYMYCCVASASKREGRPLSMSLMDFADNITAEDMAGWSQSIMSEQPEDQVTESEKKACRHP